jgi:hypothetical protein
MPWLLTEWLVHHWEVAQGNPDASLSHVGIDNVVGVQRALNARDSNVDSVSRRLSATPFGQLGHSAHRNRGCPGHSGHR